MILKVNESQNKNRRGNHEIIKEKTGISDYINIKIIFHEKQQQKQCEKRRNRDKIFTTHRIGYWSTIKCKEFLAIYNRRITYFLKMDKSYHSQIEEIQMTKKHVKRCSVSLVINEMQIKANLRNYFSAIRLEKIKKIISSADVIHFSGSVNC